MRFRSLLAGVLTASLASVACAQVAPISGLPAATTPLTGAEVVPCIQGTTVSKCTASSLGSGLAACSPSSTCSLSGTWSFSHAILTGGSVDGTPIGATTPSTGAFTTLSASGLISPASTIGIKGTATNDNAQAGSVGEIITNAGTGVSLTGGTAADAVSVSLTAGDWDVECTASFAVGASTSPTSLFVAISTTSATIPVTVGPVNELAAPFSTGQPQVMSSPVVRESLSATATVYCVVDSFFPSGTVSASSFIRARRVR